MAKKSVSLFKKKADIVFKQFIRTRDGKCLHCGNRENLQASHSIPVSHGNRLRYDEKNVITLCYHCHLNWWHKNPIEAGAWFKIVFPGNYEYVERVKNERVKFTITELEEIIKKYEDLLTAMQGGEQR